MVTTNLFASAWSAAWFAFWLAVILGWEKRSWLSSSRSAPATLTSTVELSLPPGGKTELRRGMGSCAKNAPPPAVGNQQPLHPPNPPPPQLTSSTSRVRPPL